MGVFGGWGGGSLDTLPNTACVPIILVGKHLIRKETIDGRVPTQGELHRPLLEIAAEAQKAMSAKEFLDAVAKRFSLVDSDLDERTPTGALRIKAYIGFGLSYLTTAELLCRPERGRYEITEKGRIYISEHVGKISFSDLKTLQDEEGNEISRIQVGKIHDLSPDEQILTILSDMNDTLVREISDIISSMTPGGFEHLVRDLLEAMGYGRGEVVGGSGDGGVDIEISQDRLGLEKVYIQVKRWQGKVGSQEIDKFLGGLNRRGGVKGAFVTNSSFTSRAEQAARENRPQAIRLINGDELAHYMIKHNVGVATQAVYRIKRLDADFFEQF